MQTRTQYENYSDQLPILLHFFQLALTHSPPLSDIFVFTDASPKDAHLFDAVKALALEKQSKVSLHFDFYMNITSQTQGFVFRYSHCSKDVE